jgi:VWFA-related protein
MGRRHPVLVSVTIGIAALASGQGFRERVRVGLVTVRLEARGSDGRPLPDLKASEVKLKVDGKDVPVEGLDRVESAAPAAAPKPAESASAPALLPVSPQTAAAPAVPPPSPDLYLAILVDETSTGSFDRRDAHRQIENFLKGKMAPGVHVMLERFDGHLRIECPWTSDVSRLLAAAKKMSKRTFDSRMPSPAGMADEIRSGRKPKDVELEVDLASRRTFDGILQALIEFPNDVTGRKGLVFVSDGTPLMAPFDISLMLYGANATDRDIQKMRTMGKGAVDPETAAQINAMMQDEALSTLTAFGAASDATWARRMALITKKALELDIAFYPVDSEAIERGTNPGVSSKWPGRAMPGVEGGSALPYSGSGMTARVAVTHSMISLAETTGGEAILVPNQLSDRLGTVVAERASGYALTFRDPTPGDFKYHKIEIAIERPGAKVTYRRGYRVRSDDERTLDTVIANLNVSGVAENPLNAKVSFEEIRKESGRDIVSMRLQYPRPPEAPGPGASERDVQIWAICSDDEGNRAKPLSRQSKAQSLSGEKAGPYVDAIQLGLPPGPYTWSIALKDVASGLTSYLVVKKVL